MKYHELQRLLEQHPNMLPRFVLPGGDHIPPHAHLTEVGHVVRNFIDCGGLTGREEKAVLQTHVGDDVEHRLQTDGLAKILELGARVIPQTDLNVEVEYDCCVVAQYPIADTKVDGDHLDLILGRGRTQCRARERRQAKPLAGCCSATAACC